MRLIGSVIIGILSALVANAAAVTLPIEVVAPDGTIAGPSLQVPASLAPHLRFLWMYDLMQLPTGKPGRRLWWKGWEAAPRFAAAGVNPELIKELQGARTI